MFTKLTITHDTLALIVKSPKQRVRLGLSRSRSSVSAEGVLQEDVKKIGAWYLPMTTKYEGTYQDLFKRLNAFANSCTTMEQFVAGPAVKKTISRLAAELKEKTKSAVTSDASGKYDHLYKPGMTAKEKQAVRAKARRAK